MKNGKLSLRTQITIFMTVLVALQSIALIACLLSAQVFTILDAESVRLFFDTSQSRAEDFNEAVAELTTESAGYAEALATQLSGVAGAHELAPAALSTHDEAHSEALDAAAASVLAFIDNHEVTGAFVALEGSYYHSGEDAHSMVYIRAPQGFTVDHEGYTLDVGPTFITREYGVPLGDSWALDYLASGEAATFYHTPIDAVNAQPGAGLSQYGYWTSPATPLRDGQMVITYSLPLLDRAGSPFGVFGFELSFQYLIQAYMPLGELPFANSFYAITSAPGEEGLAMDWYIPSGSHAQVRLAEAGQLPLGETSHLNLSQTSLPDLGSTYVSVHALELYGEDSVFVDNEWVLAAFVPAGALSETSSSVSQLLIGSVIVTTIVSFAGVFMLSMWSTRKIRGLSTRISSINQYDDIAIERTGLAEVDELITAVETLNQSVVESGRRVSKIMELTEMPIGCFEIVGNEVYLTDQVNQLLGFDAERTFTLKQWRITMRDLTACPEPDSENVYLWNTPGGDKWLRILQTRTGTGTVGLIVDVTDEVREHRRLAKKLDFDAMTGLYNRSAFKREAAAKIESHPDTCGAMIFADLDNLKFINDTYGHESGDVLLRRAGEMFAQLEDFGAVVARIAGDEFAMYLHGVGDRATTRKLIHQVLHSIGENTMTTTDGQRHRIRYSAGVAWYPEDSDNVSDLLRLADFAMYEAKHRRKGTVVEFNPRNYKETAYLLENSETISRLLDERLIRFDFQPIVDLRTGKVFAYEALMRSLMPEFQTAMDILAVASAQSKLYQLEQLVYTELYTWVNKRYQELGDAMVFMNSLPSQPLTDDDMRFLQIQYPNAFGRIVVEITENENTSMALIKDKVDVIRRFGGKIAIDDFGAGYSNELRILAHRPDFVKIDMGIVQGISMDSDKCLLVSSIVSFCRGKDMRIIAEGVENLEDLRTVASLGVDMVQGFYTGHPNEFPNAVETDAIEEMRTLFPSQNLQQ